MFDMFRMLVCNVFLDERRCFEQLLAGLASEFPLIFLFDERLSGFAQLSADRSAILNQAVGRD